MRRVNELSVVPCHGVASSSSSSGTAVAAERHIGDFKATESTGGTAAESAAGADERRNGNFNCIEDFNAAGADVSCGKLVDYYKDGVCTTSLSCPCCGKLARVRRQIQFIVVEVPQQRSDLQRNTPSRVSRKQEIIDVV